MPDRKDTPLEEILGHVGPKRFGMPEVSVKTEPAKTGDFVSEVRARTTRLSEADLERERGAWNKLLSPREGRKLKHI